MVWPCMKKLHHMAGFMMCHVLPSGDHHPFGMPKKQGERPVGFLPVDGDVLLPAVAGHTQIPNLWVAQQKTKASYRFSSESNDVSSSVEVKMNHRSSY